MNYHARGSVCHPGHQMGALLGIILLCLAAALGMTRTASAQETAAATTSGERFGAWTHRCENVPGAIEQQCRIEQFVVDERRPSISLLVMVFRTADKKNLFMRVVTPLGLFLPSGVRLLVDQQTLPLTIPYAQCYSVGCTAELIDNATINGLAVATSLFVIVWPTPEDPIGVPISLDGFSTALGKL